MSRITLIYKDPTYLPFCLPWVTPVVSDYIAVEQYDPAQQYDPASTCIYTSYVPEHQDLTWIAQLQGQGLPLLIDHLWDGDVDTPSAIKDNTLTLRNGNWLWYYSCLDWTQQGYNNYQPDPNWQRAFFMPMNRQEWHRDLAVETLKPVLDQALYSYVHAGLLLEDDVPTAGAINWRSYFNPSWYNTTCFSVVAESYMRSDVRNNFNNYRTEVSEKIFKPMLGHHPFIVFGSLDTLKYLDREGFATYNNLFDEGYDSVDNDRLRHERVSNTVIQAVKDYRQGKLSRDSLTIEKIQHNHARLFDYELVKKRIKDEIVADILEFVEG